MRRSESVDNMLQRQQQQHNNNGLVGVSINPAMYMMPHQGMYPQQGMQPNMDSNNNLIEMGKARTFVFQVCHFGFSARTLQYHHSENL